MTLRDLQKVINSEVNMEKRDSARSRYKEANEKYGQLKADFDSVRARRLDFEKSRDRKDLLTFRNPSERQLLLTEESAGQQEDSVLDYSSQRVDEFIVMGQNALASLRSQGSQFKGIERRAVDMARALGLSDGVIRVIQRRQSSDRVIFWTCVSVTLLLVAWIIYRKLFRWQ